MKCNKIHELGGMPLSIKKRSQKRTKLFERRWIERGDGLPPDLESTTYLSRSGRRATVNLWRIIKGDAVLLHRYRIPGCKRCRGTRFKHRALCPFYKESDQT